MRQRRPGGGLVRRTRRLLVLAAVGAVAFVLGSGGPASAHPLGNFTVNRWIRVEPTAGLVRLTYVIDLAEIPTFQDRAAIGADARAYGRARLDDAVRGLTVEVDGQPVPLAVVDWRVDAPPGDGGLPTTRIAGTLEGPVAGGATHELVLVDRNEPDRLGWRELVVDPPDGTAVRSASAPRRDTTDQLRRYPEDRLGTPLDLRRATVHYEAAGPARPARPLEGARTNEGGDRLGRLLAVTDPGPIAVAGFLGVAFLIGCGHALGPGHGKTVMAAYLVGTRGRPLDAVLLGAVVSAMHTASVLLLGVVLHRLERSTAVERIYPALTLGSGVLVLVLGLTLLVGRVRRLRPVADHHHHHDHDDDHHDHGHDAHGHGHHHGPGGHTHDLPEGVAPLSRRGLVVLAASGGIVPSPSAVIVLVSALTLGRVTFGLSLIVAFSVGLAATLSAVGLVLVYGRRLADNRVSGRLLRLFPVAGAAALVVLGTLLVTRAAVEL